MYCVDDGDGWWWRMTMMMMMIDEGVSLLHICRKETRILVYRGQSLHHPSWSFIITQHHQIYPPYTRCTLCIPYILYLLYLLDRWWRWMMMDDDDGWGSLSPLKREKTQSVSCIEKRVSFIYHHHPSSPITIIYILHILDVLYAYSHTRYLLCTLLMMAMDDDGRWWWKRESLSPVYREERHSSSCIEERVSLIQHPQTSSSITII